MLMWEIIPTMFEKLFKLGYFYLGGTSLSPIYERIFEIGRAVFEIWNRNTNLKFPNMVSVHCRCVVKALKPSSSCSKKIINSNWFANCLIISIKNYFAV